MRCAMPRPEGQLPSAQGIHWSRVVPCAPRRGNCYQPRAEDRSVSGGTAPWGYVSVFLCAPCKGSYIPIALSYHPGCCPGVYSAALTGRWVGGRVGYPGCRPSANAPGLCPGLGVAGLSARLLFGTFNPKPKTQNLPRSPPTHSTVATTRYQPVNTLLYVVGLMDVDFSARFPVPPNFTV